MKKEFFSPFHLYLFGLWLLAVALPLSMFLMSIAQFVLLGAWLWDGSMREKMRLFFSNKLAVALVGIWILHLAGLLYTADLNAGIKDLRIKLPLLIFPLVTSSMQPLTRKQAAVMLYFFIAAVVTATLVSTGILIGLTGRSYTDIREISIFISHIRFALLICLATFFAAYFLFTGWHAYSGQIRIVFILTIIWLLIFQVLLESATGITITLLVLLLVVLYLILRQGTPRLVRLGLSVLLVATGLAVYQFIKTNVQDFYALKGNAAEPLVQLTSRGNRYDHYPENREAENGHKVWMYVCLKEMEEEWNKRSPLDFNGRDRKGNEIRFTLMRFLSSKGLKKDAAGVNALSAREIAAVENGIPNVTYQGAGNIRARFHRILWEYDRYRAGADPSGHSVTMRFEFWKTALGVINENPFSGVGTGDVDKAMQTQYEKMKSPLSLRWRLRAHNQFLEIAVALGTFAAAFFLLTMLWPLVICRPKKDFLYAVFGVIALLSMCTEDTLETQAGVTFYAFFNSFLLFCRRKEERKVI